ncbi:hypothetical protein GCM10020221_15590 [Streptomyces thioluteus]|uniref:Lipoprotein n=1 Tax=Streptomyces thioluteus TaxID=66431 RepID=A0ABP6J487_STRTU
MAMSHAWKTLAVGALLVLASCAGFASTAAARPVPNAASAAAGAAAVDDEMPFAVEKFEYPGAAKILQERGITLRKGDGRILLADCSASHDVMVKSRTGQQGLLLHGQGQAGLPHDGTP